jgi:PadR family transcriptional regulator AphA
MALRYAILGYLSSAPGSGYDLAQQLDGGLGWFWSAAHSQIYPELKRLEDGGLIQGSATTVGERLEKRVYSITEAGREELTSWALGLPRYRPNRDPERLQLIFSDLGSIDSIRRHLEAHREHFARRRERLMETREQMASRRHARVEQRLVGRDPSQQALTLLLRDLAYGGEVERAETEIRWADDALARLDEHERRFNSTARRSNSSAAKRASAGA